MSVRSSLLAILSLGPAYGFQLHLELRSRTAGRRTVNVGQIYGTLERLVAQGCIESAGQTDDGLPLYRLTESGAHEGHTWLHSTSSAAGEEWADLVDRVLIASSLPEVDTLQIIDAYIAKWSSAPLSSVPVSPQERLAVEAGEALAKAAITWLRSVRATLAAAPGDAYHRGFSDERPRRGRRPSEPLLVEPQIAGPTHL